MAERMKETLMKRIFQLNPKTGSKEKSIFGINQSGDKVAVSTVNSSQITFYNKNAEKDDFQIQIPQALIQHFEFDTDGVQLAIQLKEKIVIYNLNKPKQEPIVIDSEIGAPSCMAWSSKSTMISIGTVYGGIILYSFKTTKKHSIAGKHSKKITHMAWNSLDMLISRSEEDTIHATKENGENIDDFSELSKSQSSEVDRLLWIDNITLSDKILTDKQGAQNQSKPSKYQQNLDKLKNSKTTNTKNEGEISQSKKNGQQNNYSTQPLLVVVNKSGKELWIVHTADFCSIYKIPFSTNMGRVIQIDCNQLGEIIVATNRGLMIKWTFTNGAFVEVQTERFFQNSMDICNIDIQRNKAFICGDNCMKLVDLKSLKEEKEYRVTFEKNIGNFTSLLLNKNNSLIFVQTNSAGFYGYMIQSEQKAKVFPKHYTVKISLSEVMVKPIGRKLDSQCVDELETIAPQILKIPGPEIIDYVLVQNFIITAHSKEIVCYDIQSASPVEVWRKTIEKPVLRLMTDDKSKVLVIFGSEIMIVNTNVKEISNPKLNMAKFPNFKVRFYELFTVVLSRNQLFIFENTNLKQIIASQTFPNVTDMFINPQSFEFYFYDNQKNTLFVFKNKLDNFYAEIELQDTSIVSELLFDTQNPNIFCVLHESGKVYTICKKSTHYKNQISFKIVREILQPSDLEESNENNVEYAITLVDSDILPIQLTDGYLFCLEKGVTPTGCYLSSHSFKIGSLYQITDEVKVEVDLLLNQTQNRTKTNIKSSELLNRTKEVEKQTDLSKKTVQKEILSEPEKEYYLKSFFQTTELGLFSLAFKASELIQIPSLWSILATISLKNMNLDISMVCYQKLENWSMSYYIQNLLTKNKISFEIRCDIAVILCDYEYAKSCYMQMGRPELAVELLINLHEFQAALEISKMNGLREHELFINYELAELDLKNEEYIKAENGYEGILKQMANIYGVLSLNQNKSVSKSSSVKNSLVVSREVEKREEFQEKPIFQNQIQKNDKITFKKFIPVNLFRSTVFGLSCLYIRQGSVIKATECLNKLSSENSEELEELAQIAKENEQYLLASEIYIRIGCTKRELEVKLFAITKNSQTTKLQVDDFAKEVSSKLVLIKDAEVFLKLALFFQEKNNDLAEKMFKASENVVEYIKFALFILNDISKAERIYEENKMISQQAACFIAEYFIQNLASIKNGRQRAIKYFLFSGRKLEALKMSFETDSVEHYCEFVQNFDEKEANTLAKFFVSRNKYDQAGKFFLLANQYEKSLLSFVKAKDFDSAIDLVFRLNDEELFDLMVQVFAGETIITANERIHENLLEDNSENKPQSNEFFELIGKNARNLDETIKNRLSEIPEPVDPIYLFKLYLKFSRSDQANTIALAIIDRELIDGSYKSAYQHACVILTHLLQAKIKINVELRNKIIVLHSYVLVKKALKNNNHILAALLLNRVCSFLHYLPKADTDILTSAVIEATKSGLKAIAYNWALTLCKPQFRSSINPKFKEKIEKIALKPVNNNELQNQNFSEIGWIDIELKQSSLVAKCPSCNLTVNDCFNLSCNSCFNNFFTCIATGKALLNCGRKTFVKCRLCLGIGYEEEVQEIFNKEGVCPMCDKNEKDLFLKIDISEISKLMNE